MLWIQAVGNDISIDGLNFEGNNKSVYGLKIQETESPYQASVNISNCKFRNMYIPASNPFLSLSFNETTGVFVYGSYNNVIIDKCLFQNITRAKIASAAGSSGLVLSGEVISGKYQATKTATISSCYFENITSGETSAYGSTANIDCDALKFFGGNVFGTDYVDCRASIYGNHFVNCRGRDIKVQADEVTIQANTSSTNILPITNGFGIVQSGKKIGLIDEEGKYLVNPQFDEINYDLLIYLINDGTLYESVNSDYFNIAPIVSRINLSSPEGLTLGSTLGDLINKVNVKEDIFNQYRDTHLVLENIPLTSDATLNFSVQANSHKEVEDGWYLVSVFNSAAPITGFSYTINLSGKGYSKADQVLAAIEKGIKGCATLCVITTMFCKAFLRRWRGLGK
jgi:hypothetical protein